MPTCMPGLLPLVRSRCAKALYDKRDVPVLRRAHVPAEPHPRRRTRMPTSPRKPSMYERASSAGIDAMIDRVAPAILELLADGMPRSKAEIVAVLAERHDRQDVISTLMRLTVTGELEQAGSKYTPAAPGGDGPPEAA